MKTKVPGIGLYEKRKSASILFVSTDEAGTKSPFESLKYIGNSVRELSLKVSLYLDVY